MHKRRGKEYCYSDDEEELLEKFVRDTNMTVKEMAAKIGRGYKATFSKLYSMGINVREERARRWFT